ncbi:iron-sulfur cluster assembly accessory protein [Candidatus Comchoanobacter bicostacola]|uniref:Iron-sulfur cluster assembly accessory protein n=1 Tax=Candidatus Comchoanobacter bicostacola TaxID=2919598 RepID=A0ABY5DLK8_9GAMM|nr:iron-sulfur cluster assembly accessory protein [Candidatus Comchoanobacter bicostacola]UTC24529.1 iron-sulfur cluster assembly accessory protein [Candidatus Comchoanobacter bicostacola]
MNTNDITFTNSASGKIATIIQEHGATDHFRIKIQGGGCMGFEYVFGLDKNKSDQDFYSEVHNPVHPFLCLVDHRSFALLRNATIDFIQDTDGARFEVINSSAQTCSCKRSFSPSTGGTS